MTNEDAKNHDSLTVLTARRPQAHAAKVFTRDEAGEIAVQSYANGKLFDVEEVAFSGLAELHELLKKLQGKPYSFAIRGEPIRPASQGMRRRLVKPDPGSGDPAEFCEKPRTWFMLDMDKLPCPPATDPAEDPEGAAEYLVGLLPPEFWDASYIWQWSSSQNVKNFDTLSCHLFFLADRPLSSAELTRWGKSLQPLGVTMDLSVFRTVQPHYIAAPLFNGMRDPLPRRLGYREGLYEAVPLFIPDLVSQASIASVSGFEGSSVGGIGFEAKLDEIGGHDGFNRPVTAAIASYMAASSVPDLAYLKARLRETISRANPGARGEAEIARYMSDTFLEPIIAWCAKNERARTGGAAFGFTPEAAAKAADPRTKPPDKTGTPTQTKTSLPILPNLNTTKVNTTMSSAAPLHLAIPGLSSALEKARQEVASSPAPFPAEGLTEGLASAKAKPAEEEEDTSTFDLRSFAVSSMKGKAPERHYLVSNIFPLGVPIVIAGQGAVGKSMLVLDLALKVAEWDGTGEPPRAFCGPLSAHGSVVLVSAEDDWEELHRRIDALDPDGSRRQKAGERLMLVPLGKIGGGPFAKETSKGLEFTPSWFKFYRSLKTIPDIVMFSLDPLSVFFHINQNDTSQAYTVMARLGDISSDLKASGFLVHHFGKTRDGVSSAEEARALVKGNTAIVDGSRVTYALWSTDSKTAEGLAEVLGEELKPKKFISGGIVKANYKHDSSTHYYLRPEDTPVPHEIRDGGRLRGQIADERIQALGNFIAMMYDAGDAFAATGEYGLFARRAALPGAWSVATRTELEEAVDALLASGTLVKHKEGRRVVLVRP